MASTIILSDNGASSGSAGLKQTAGNDGVLILQTTTSGGTATNVLTLDNSQNIGMNMAPSAWGSGAGNAFQMAGFAMWGSSGTGHLSTNTYFDGTNYKYIATGTVMDYYQSGGAHIFRASDSGSAGATVSTFANLINVAKGQTLALQGGTQSSGTGIAFPASQSASTDANTLDDYEEGTWTPTLGGSSSDPSATYNTQSGYYTKIGRQVTIYYYLYPATYSGGSGTLFIKGVPFTNGAANIMGSVYTSLVGWSTKTMALSYMPPTVAYVRTICTAANVGDYDVQVNDVAAGDVIIGTITYFV